MRRNKFYNFPGRPNGLCVNNVYNSLCFLRFLLFQTETATMHPLFAKADSYMKLLNVPLGLLFNFHEVKLVDGISRLMLPGANQP